MASNLESSLLSLNKIAKKKRKCRRKSQINTQPAMFDKSTESITNYKTLIDGEKFIEISNKSSKRHKNQSQLPILQTRSVTNKHLSRQQHPAFPHNSHHGNTISNRSFSEVREELHKDRAIIEELSVRLQEAKQSLIGLDPVLDNHDSPAQSKARRIPSLDQQHGRVSFLAVSRQVASMVRFRNVAQPKISDLGPDRELSMEKPENLPKTPRFSSYMSAAAQYALMKGYEDIIFEKLSSRYPECTGMLRRNKTPHHSVVFLDKPAINVLNPRDLSQDNKDNQDMLNQDLEIHSVLDKENQAIIRQKELDDNKHDDIQRSKIVSDIAKRNSEDFQDILINKVTLENKKAYPLLNSSNISDSSVLSSHPSDSYIITNKTTHQKYSSCDTASTQTFPGLARMSPQEQLGRDRRIVLSYRLEKAMDILDLMKTKSEHALSPRISVLNYRRRKPPLRDFNRWADQWAHEFNSDAVM